MGKGSPPKPRSIKGSHLQPWRGGIEKCNHPGWSRGALMLATTRGYEYFNKKICRKNSGAKSRKVSTMVKPPLTAVDPGSNFPSPPRKLGAHGLDLWSAIIANIASPTPAASSCSPKPAAGSIALRR